MCLPCSLQLAKLDDAPNCNALIPTAVRNDSGRPLPCLTSGKNVNDSTEGDAVSGFVNLAI